MLFEWKRNIKESATESQQELRTKRSYGSTSTEDNVPYSPRRIKR